MSQHLMNTYARQPVTFVKGEGAWLWDEQGSVIWTHWPVWLSMG